MKKYLFIALALLFGCLTQIRADVTNVPCGQLPALTGDVTTSGAACGTTLATGNAGNLNSGTLNAARMPALTGDTTTSAGSVATTTTKINGVDQTTAWSTFTPSFTCGTATFTTNSAKSKTIGKSINIEFDFTISGIGNCTSEVDFTLPVAPNSSAALTLFDTTNVTSGNCFWITTSSTARCFKTGGANFTAVRFVGSGVYESQ